MYPSTISPIKLITIMTSASFLTFFLIETPVTNKIKNPIKPNISKNSAGNIYFSGFIKGKITVSLIGLSTRYAKSLSETPKPHVGGMPCFNASTKLSSCS